MPHVGYYQPIIFLGLEIKYNKSKILIVFKWSLYEVVSWCNCKPSVWIFSNGNLIKNYRPQAFWAKTRNLLEIIFLDLNTSSATCWTWKITNNSEIGPPYSVSLLKLDWKNILRSFGEKKIIFLFAKAQIFLFFAKIHHNSVKYHPIFKRLVFFLIIIVVV